MADVIFLALVLGFFSAAVGLVTLCERIVGDGDVTVLDTPDATAPAEVAA